MNLLIGSCFLSAVSLLSRGWIVPVGGSTPDRLSLTGSRTDRFRGDRLSQDRYFGGVGEDAGGAYGA